jgi:anti-sigma B factor antagonist
MRRFELKERESRDGCRVVAVSGELDLAVAGELDELLTRVGGESPLVVVDLAGCEFIDYTGIAVILRAHQRLNEGGGGLAVCSPSAQVLRVLSMTGLTANGLVFASEDQALAAVKNAH